MPWPGEHAGEHGDDADDDVPTTPPLPPDDRLWRHPSELGRLRPSSPAPVPSQVPPRQPSPPRLWAIALTSGLTGAALAVGIVALVGGLGPPVRERIVDRVPLPVVDGASTATVPGGAGGPTQVAADVMPSIVRIDVETVAGRSSGSGVVIRDDGAIVTNAHVVADAVEVVVVLADGSTFEATVVGEDEPSDIAVVTVDDGGSATWVPAVLGTATDLEVGQEMVVIGSALGLDGPPSVTVGIVSALGQRVASNTGAVLHDMIQTDATIARGASGGALCDRTGVVVGITTAHDESGALGFATPIDVAKAVADELLAAGHVANAWLGIEGADLDGVTASSLGLATSGAAVHAVAVGGPAQQAGVEAGDVIVAIDDEPVRSMSHLVVALREREPGDVVELRVQRGGDLLTFPVVLADRP